MGNIIYLTIIALYIIFITNYNKNKKITVFDTICSIIIGVWLTLIYFFDKNPSRWEWQKNLTRLPEVILGVHMILFSLFRYFKNKENEETTKS